MQGEVAMIDPEKRLKVETLRDELIALINDIAREEKHASPNANKEIVKFTRMACYEFLDAALADGYGGCELCGS